MIEKFYIPCELYRGSIETDSMGITIPDNYVKIADITGVIISKSNRQIYGNQYHYVEQPMFVTNDEVLELDRIKYKGKTYKVTSVPDNVMERNHHYEFTLEVV